MQGAEADLRMLRIDLSLRKLEMDNLKGRLEKIADEPVSASDLRKAFSETKYLASGLTVKLKPLLDVQNELDAEIAKYTRFPDSPQKHKAIQGLAEQRKANEGSIDVEE